MQRRGKRARFEVPRFEKVPRRPRKTPAEVDKPCEEALAGIDIEIARLEIEIKALAAEHESMRSVMLSGMMSTNTADTQKRLLATNDRLDVLKTERNKAMTEIERIIFEKAATLDPKNKLYAHVDRPRGMCQGGCQDLVYDPHSAADICTSCGTVYDHSFDATPEHFDYDDIHPSECVPRRRGGGYKPPNHFAEILAQFQGKRRSAAPQDVVEVVGKCCERYHFKPHQITPKVVRMFLKQKQQEETSVRKYAKKQPNVDHPPRKYTDYYRHCPEIAWRLSGIPPPYMTPSQEDRIIALFPMVVNAYKTSPRYLSRKSDRSNRVKENPNQLNYLYILYKICELLGYSEFLPYIPLPKSIANIEDCDTAGWKHICAVNGWSYTQTSRYT